MSRKPESTFSKSVHRYFPPVDELHREKMNNPYNSGTADFWFSSVRDLWVEYKFVVLPKRADTLVKVELSELQKLWVDNRVAEGRNVWVIVGCAAGGVIMKNGEWHRAWTKTAFEQRILTRQLVAEHLLSFLGGQ